MTNMEDIAWISSFIRRKLMMEVLYVALFTLPLIVDICIGYDSYMCCHSKTKAMAWFSAGLLAQIVVGVSIL